jgi:hypothetical protein
VSADRPEADEGLIAFCFAMLPTGAGGSVAALPAQQSDPADMMVTRRAVTPSRLLAAHGRAVFSV